MSATQPIPFDEFMDRALYGSDGFYMRSDGGHAGRRGDFLTSPEVGPLFGVVLASFLDVEWTRLGRPDPFTVVDAGAGPGTLARSVLAAAPECAEAMRYVAVELSPAQRQRHPAGVESVARLADEPFDGVIIANELLDNLPFRLAVYDQGWREAFVEQDGSGGWSERLSGVFDPVPDHLPRDAAHGARAPLVDRAARWVREATAQLNRGTVIAIDYGVATTGELANRPWREWLRTYRRNERGDHYLRGPGTQDITTEIGFDQLAPPDALRTQAQFLRLHGIAELVEEGRRHWAEHAGHPDLRAMRMRSRISESEALLDPAGLGGFMVAEWRID